jgi:hypothetical protein
MSTNGSFKTTTGGGLVRRLPSCATGVWLAAVALCAILASPGAQALPQFARQTGQNCVACHAGGQFPELTQYGRLFKLTGYTMGDRVAVPLSVMGVASVSKVFNTSKSDDPAGDFQKNGDPIFATGSVFTGGKITDNLGAFVQVTYDNYASQTTGPPPYMQPSAFQGHTAADNMDFRYADRYIGPGSDFIFGVSVNNNVSVSDPWNTAAAWMQYVPVPSPTSSRFIDGTAPYPGYGIGQARGLNAYMYWNQTVYAELGAYATANKGFSFMSTGTPDSATSRLAGNNPYWRFALTRQWGAHNFMVGTSGMIAHVYDNGSDMSDPGNLGRIKSVGVDAQYQYILDPHTVTAQLAFMRQTVNYSANTIANAASPYFLADGVTPVAAANPSDITNTLRAKVSYIYLAKVGGSLGFFNLTGTTNTLNQTSGYDSNGQITSTDPLGTGITSTRVGGNLSGNPATRGFTYEAFWLPIQYMRVGVQFTAYNKYNGATNNYDGFGRNARDNNSLFLYVWGAY